MWNVEDVKSCFEILLDNVPEDFLAIAKYFGINYFRGIPAVRRRKTVPPRYRRAL